jgi:hypothetical protein
MPYRYGVRGRAGPTYRELLARVEVVENDLRRLAAVVGVDLAVLAADEECDCDTPAAWECMEACGQDPLTGEALA